MIDTVTKHKSPSLGEVNSYEVTYVDSNIIKYIPLDPDNTDYQRILEWEKIDGNTIKDAD